MPGAPIPPHSGHSGGGLTTADGRPVEFRLSEDHQRALDQVLKAGTVVSGRVVERFPGDTYLINLRGRQILAQSAAPLMRDSVVRLAVLSTEQGLKLRLEGTGPSSGDQALTSQPGQRLAGLGIPDSTAARLALAVFEEAGAPLTPPTRLQQAAQTLSSNTAATVPELLRQAASHALLAQARLPVTPALLALAERALVGQLPNPGSALQNLRALLPQVSGGAASGGPPAGKQAATNVGHQPSPAPAPATTASSRAQPAPAANGANPQLATTAKTPTNPGPPPAANPTTSAPAPANPPPSAHQQAPAPLRAPPPATAPAPAPTASGATPPTTVPTAATATPASSGTLWIGSAQLPVATTTLATLLPSLDLAQGARQAISNALHSMGIHPKTDGTGATPAAHSLPAETNPTTPAPPPSSRESASGNALPPPQVEMGSLLRQLVDTMREVAGNDPNLRAGVHQAAREMLAETLLPPRHLNDYDLVLPLSLFHHQQPLPARLALASREAGGLNATFLRIDVELSQLGPLSLRFSDTEGSPLALSIFHTPAARTALEAGIPDLEQDLQDLEIETHLRLLDMSEHG